MATLDQALWRDILGYLRQRYSAICRQWFDDLEPIGLNSGLLTVQADKRVHQNYLQKKCLSQFTEAAQAVTGKLIAVRFVTDEDLASGGVTSPWDELDRAGANGRQARPATELESEELVDLDADQIVISPDHSFENFISGPANQLAYAAAVAVARQPGTAYNPLFIHGGVGLGKTHLLQAICQTVMEERPRTRILYVSCDTFTNQFITCVQARQMHRFRQRYRHADMLVIDDIHFLGRGHREQSQEEFFHTFNELYQSNRQIVMSSDAPPAEIPHLEERLVSRFQCGLVATVTRPHFETRVAILRAKARLRGLKVPDAVYEYLANRIDSNARDLEGTINTLAARAQLQGDEIDLRLAQQVLNDRSSETAASPNTLQAIIKVVTDHYNVRLSDLQSRRRHKSVTEPRQVCMYLARKRTRFSLEEIGGYFGGRDHTTVMHSIRTVGDRLSTEQDFARQIHHLEEKLHSNGSG